MLQLQVFSLTTSVAGAALSIIALVCALKKADPGIVAPLAYAGIGLAAVGLVSAAALVSL